MLRHNKESEIPLRQAFRFMLTSWGVENSTIVKVNLNVCEDPTIEDDGAVTMKDVLVENVETLNVVVML